MLSWTLHISNMVSRVRSRIASILCYGSLPLVVLCVLYTAFVMPLFDIVWCPTTTERVHSKFLKKFHHLLPPDHPLL